MKNKIIHPFLLALWPILALYDYNKQIADPSYLWRPLLVALIISIIIYFLFKLWLKDLYKTALISSIFIIFLFSYGHFLNVLISWATLTSIEISLGFGTIVNILFYVILGVWLLFFSLGSLLVIKKGKHLKEASFFFNILSIILVTLSISSIGIFTFNDRTVAKENIFENIEIVDTENRPDIYYIIFDSYASDATLAKYYNYNNEEFSNFLKDKGFYVAKNSHSNYQKTIFSIPSSLNMDYLQNIIPDDLGEDEYMRRLMEAIRDNKTYDFLKARGYSFVTMPSTWFGTYNNLKSDINIAYQAASTDFEDLLINNFLGNNVSIFNDDKRQRFFFTIDKIGTIADIEEPTFSYIHILKPHDPFIFDANGNPIEAPLGRGWGAGTTEGNLTIPAEYRKKYVDQLKFLNKKIFKIVEDILSRSPEPPIIVIQADHGPGSFANLSSDGLRERMSILNAYYLPYDEIELYDSITPVNSFRIIFNEVFGADFEILPDRSYLSSSVVPNTYEDISDKLK